MPQFVPTSLKSWLRRPEHQAASKHILIISAGTTDVATARKLAEHGIHVTVLETEKAAQAGSGNRQSLLYAKVLPHGTEQTELLLTGYDYTRRLLENLLPNSDARGSDGVLRLNSDDSKHKRNQAPGLQHQHKHLYCNVLAEEAASIVGIDVSSDDLYWPQGAWLNPPAVMHALLSHPLIELHERSPLTAVSYNGVQWAAHTPDAHFNTNHTAYCMGVHGPTAADTNASALPFRQVRDQTGVVFVSPFPQRLHYAISDESYTGSSWQGSHCYSAAFVLNSNDETWYPRGEADDRAALYQFNPPLIQSPSE